METTGSANKLNEFMKRCLAESCESHIDGNPHLKTNPKLAQIFKAGYYLGAADHSEFMSLVMEECTNGVVQTDTEQST